MFKPMKAYDCPPDNLPGIGWGAEDKLDGYRMTMVIKDGIVRCFSYTGKEMTAKLPQFQNCFREGFADAILDGELVPLSGNFNDLKSIVGAKAPKAIAWQEEHGFALFRVFDVVELLGADIQNRPLWKRKDLLWWYLGCYLSSVLYINPVITYVLNGEPIADKAWVRRVDSFEELCEITKENGIEGLMFKNLFGIYEQKKSKNVLKLKWFKTFDVIVMGFTEPTREYKGKTNLDKWPYWENYDGQIRRCGLLDDPTIDQWPVTKPYAMGWPGAVVFGVYKSNNQLVKVGECSGFTEADMEYIKNNKYKLIGTVVEVSAQRIEDPTIGSLRHPQFSRWRDDKPVCECTWDNHINQ